MMALEHSDINRNFLEKEKEFWNVPSMEDAMFKKIYTDSRIINLPREEQHREWYKTSLESMHQILGNLPFAKEWKVLEIGCGIGRIIKPLRYLFSQVDGVDIAEKMVEFSGQYLAEAPGAGRVFLNSGSDLNMIQDNTYDLVYSMITFQHIRSASIVRSYFREIWRVLKPGGYFKLQVYDTSNPNMGRPDEEAVAGVQYGLHGNAYSESDLNALFGGHGFTDITLLHEKPWIWGTGRKDAGKPPLPAAEASPSQAHAPASVSEFMEAITSLVEKKDVNGALDYYEANRHLQPNDSVLREFDGLIQKLVSRAGPSKKKNL